MKKVLLSTVLFFSLTGLAQEITAVSFENAGELKGSTQKQKELPYMLSTRWNQKSPFNDDCPQNTIAGCGAIAIAQIMNYYKKPSVGFGQVSYLCANNVVVDANFSEHPFDWNRICDFYGTNDTDSTERKAVANLVFMAGAAAKTNYGQSSTAQWHKILWGLQHYLHFTPLSRFHHRRFYSTEEWKKMISHEINEKRPVLYCGQFTKPDTAPASHIFVIDGHDENDNYHFNFGNYGSNRDQFSSLNIISTGDSNILGYGGGNYHHYQSMATELYPEDGLTDNDFDYFPVALSSPMALEGNTNPGDIMVKDKVLASFTYSTVFFDNKVKGELTLGFYRNGELKATSEVHEPITRNNIKIPVNNKYFTLPNLGDGNYEMSIISRNNDSDFWTRGWDDAPNSIPVTVSGKLFTFHLPDYHCGETNLCLEGGLIIDRDKRIVEFNVHNPSSNNFEDTLRVSFNNQVHSLLTSVYDGQTVTYRFPIDSSTTADGIQLSYHETIKNMWIPLKSKTESLKEIIDCPTFHYLYIYSLNGKLLKKFHSVEQIEYDRFIKQLPLGIYILQDQKGVRKFIQEIKE